MDQHDYGALGALVTSRLVRRKRDCEDVSQNTILRLLKNRKPILKPSFALRAAQFELQSARRSDVRYRFHVDRATRGKSAIDEKNDIEVAIASMDARALVDRAFSRMRPMEVELLRRHLMEDEKLADIAKKADVAPETIRQRLKRAKRRFMEVLGPMAENR